MRSGVSRREFAKAALAGLAVGAAPPWAGAAVPERLRVAAIQMAPKLGDVSANLEQAEKLVRAAFAKGAQIAILPEMFTSAMGFHPDILEAIRPVEGVPLQLMRNLARDSDALVGGSFLASDGEDVYNSFLLVAPDGSYSRHDKDYPTYWESCFYRAGKDDGVLGTPFGPAGAALCWELIRTRTARRLLGKVKFVMSGSCWWSLPDETVADHPLRALNLKMLQDAVPRMARLLGVPVIHGSHAGRFEAFRGPELANIEFNSDFMGETMIVDAAGSVLARMAGEEGAGFVSAEIAISATPQPSERLPERYWLPPEMPEDWKTSWKSWLASGADYYGYVTQPYVREGVIRDYEPPYFRN